jgi:hypothetical protein
MTGVPRVRAAGTVPVLRCMNMIKESKAEKDARCPRHPSDSLSSLILLHTLRTRS